MTFHDLYTAHAADVRRFALFLCRDEAMADDITSETFVRAWTALGGIRERTVKTYLLTIARNLYRDALRRRKPVAPLEETLADPGASAADRFEAAADLENVLAALNEAAEDDRNALLWHARDHLSYEEIGARLGLSAAAIKMRIHRTRAALKQRSGR